MHLDRSATFTVVATLLWAVAAQSVAPLPAGAQSRRIAAVDRSTDDELVMTVRPRIAFTSLGGDLLLPRVDGAVIANVAAPDEPIRLEIRLPVGLPGRESADLEVVSVAYDRPRRGRIATLAESMGQVGRSDSMVPTLGAAAELRYLGIARDLHVAHVVVHPLRVADGGEGVEPIMSITLRVRFRPTARMPSEIGQEQSTIGACMVNWEVARKWAEPPRLTGSFRRPLAEAPRVVFRFEVSEEGLYSLSRQTLEQAGANPSELDAQGVAIYGGPPDLPESERLIDSNLMRPLPVLEQRDVAGRFERVMFYASGPAQWIPVEGDTLPRYLLSPYVKANSYIVGVGGTPSPAMQPVRVIEGATEELNWGIGRTAFEEDRVNAIDVRRVGGGSGRDWYGTEFVVDPAGRSTDRRQFDVSVPGIVRGRPIAVRVRVANAGKDRGDYPNRKPADGTFRFDLDGISVGSPVTIQGLGQYGRSYAHAVVLRQEVVSGATGDRLTVGIEFSNAVEASGFLDRIEAHYVRSLRAVGDVLTFDAPSGDGAVSYRADGFSSDDLVGLDLTDPVAPRLLQRQPGAGYRTFVFTGRRSGPNDVVRYHVAARSAARPVERLTSAAFGDLRGRARNADLLIITHDDMIDAAERLAGYRNGLGKIRAAVIPTSQIYTEYSHGNLDPTAIRDFVGQAFRTWTTRPRYVLFLGDATYDYRNILTRQKQLVPTYQTDDGDYYDENASAAFDDFMVRVDGSGNQLIDIAHGRIPVETSEQANQVIDKIIAYERAGYGAWRHTIILASDDELPPNTGDGFAGQSEWLDREFIPSSFDLRKIYLAAYPTETGGGGARKPRAAADLRTFVDRGALITNWIGHGNPKQWAHELLLEKDIFIPQTRNDSVLTFVTAATCNFGLYDDPGQQSGGEMFLLRPGAGAIAVMSASRASYIYQNEMLAGELFSNLFERDPTTGTYRTVGEIMMLTKIALGNGDNEEKYHIFGDPSMLLNMPPQTIAIDSINGRFVDDVPGDPPQIAALSLARVSGAIRGAGGEIDDSFQGRATVALYDAQRTTTITDGRSLDVATEGGRLYRGSVPVVNGRFAANFRVPRDIAFDSASARVHVYAVRAGGDAVGATRDLAVFGSDSLVTTDTTGPVITVYLDDRSFRSGDVVSSRPLLIVDAEDDNGVNAAASQIGRGVSAWIDDDDDPIDLSELFLTSDDDANRGTAQRLLEDLRAGRHSVRVRAWDIFNNPATASVIFEVSEGDDDDLRISQVVNFPNPFATTTEFTFLHNQSRPLDVDIAIFTLSGRRIRALTARSVTDRFVRIPWDGTDADGDLVANGVYLYRLRAVRADDPERSVAEILERIVIMR
jgi:hypothetical protein